jgi:hypothetical protein
LLVKEKSSFFYEALWKRKAKLVVSNNKSNTLHFIRGFFNMLKYALAITTALSVVAISVPAFAGSANTMVGTWVNTDSNTRGITKIVITESGSQYEVHAFGKCHPNDCDWGKTLMTTYGDDVSDPTHKVGMAEFNPGFAKTMLSIQQSGNRITLDGFTNFTDGSGRQNYHNRYNFRKLSAR